MKEYKDIINAGFVYELKKLTSNMYRLGWDERNSGNVSYLLTEEEVKAYVNIYDTSREIDLGITMPSLKGKYFIVTGSGKYFKNVEENPEDALCIVKINDQGNKGYILWGLKNGGLPTSEFSTHLQGHEARLKVDDEHRAVIHTHPTYTNVMSLTTEVSDKVFTRKLWETATEAIVVFPEGVSVVPWMVCGTNEIGVETAKKLKDYRFVVWTTHGVFGTGKSFDDAFGLIETVEKIAMMYVLANGKIINQLKNDDLVSLAKRFKVEPKAEFLK